MTENIIENAEIKEILNTDVSKKKLEKKKHIKYPKQRNEILKQIYEIIGVSLSKPYFKSHEIDNSLEIDNKIKDLDNDLQTYFNVGSWPAYKSKNTIDKKALSIVRSVLKEMNIEYSGSTQKLLNNPDVKYTTLYTINSEIK
jgi:hypothetical protein